MFDIKWIRENPRAFDEGMQKRGIGPQSSRLIALDDARRQAVTRLQDAQARRRAISREIGEALAKGDHARAETLKAETAALRDTIQTGEAEERHARQALADALASLPNLPLEDVPVGPDESANVEVRAEGARPQFPFAPKQHFEIGEKLGGMDFERAAKLAGSRFTLLGGQLARLERALGQFMLDLHVAEHGYREISPPLLVNDATMFGTGQLPKFADDLFLVRDERPAPEDSYRVELSEAGGIEIVFTGEHADQLASAYDGKVMLRPQADERLERQIRPLLASNRWLIPTAEVPLTNIIAGEILDGDRLPLRMTALTPCFRSEAGAAGRDTRGMLRQHQFWKVELVSITDPDSSAGELERMLDCAETVLRRLGLHYRIVLLSSGDMGFSAAKTYDIEVWLPGQNTYREISSCSNCGEFQARRMNGRYRDKAGAPAFVHTLNGSGVAVGRALIAVLESYQNEDGSVSVPEALRGYMGGIDRLEPEV